jgi:hypothetical protein
MVTASTCTSLTIVACVILECHTQYGDVTSGQYCMVALQNNLSPNLGCSALQPFDIVFCCGFCTFTCKHWSDIHNHGVYNCALTRIHFGFYSLSFVSCGVVFNTHSHVLCLIHTHMCCV